MSLRRSIVGLAVALAASAVISKQGHATTRVRAKPLSGPVTTTAGVFWGEQRGIAGTRFGEVTVLRSWWPTRRTSGQKLPKAPDRGRGRVDEMTPQGLAAVGRTVAFERQLDECGRDLCSLNGSELLVGRFGSVLAPLVSPRLCGSDADAPSSYALTQDVLVYARVSGTCSFRRHGGPLVVLRDLRTNAETILTRASDDDVGFEVRAAGRFVAWVTHRPRSQSQLRILDLGARERGIRKLATPGGVSTWDIAEDGTVAYAQPKPDLLHARVTVVPPTGPRRILVARALLEERTPDADDTRPVFALAPGRLAMLVSDAPAPDGAPLYRLGLVRLDDGDRFHTIARFSPRRRRIGQVDLDRRRVVWASRRVDRVRHDCPSARGQLAPCLTSEIGPSFVHAADVPSGRP